MHLCNYKLKEQFQHVNNKGEIFSSTSYEITQARLHFHKHGAAAAALEAGNFLQLATWQDSVTFVQKVEQRILKD